MLGDLSSVTGSLVHWNWKKSTTRH